MVGSPYAAAAALYVAHAYTQHALPRTTYIDAGTCDGVIAYDSTAARTSTVAAQILIAIANAGAGEIHDVTIDGVAISDRCASGNYVNTITVRAPNANAVIKGVSIAGLQMSGFRSGPTYGGKISLETQGGTGSVSDVSVTGSTFDEIFIETGIAKTIGTGNRVRAAVTDNGTGTIFGPTLNAIG